MRNQKRCHTGLYTGKSRWKIVKPVIWIIRSDDSNVDAIHPTIGMHVIESDNT
jgi:hypothetical protein